MKLLATSDIHQSQSKWKALVKATKEEKPDVVAIAGDLFPHNNGILREHEFLIHLKKYAKQIQKTGAELVLTLGNDDNQLLIPEMEKGEEDGLWHYVHGKVFEKDGYEFIGMAYVPDYPFGYKFWCHPEFLMEFVFDDDLGISEFQITSPVIINEDNEFEIVEDYEEYMKGKQSIYNVLCDYNFLLKDAKKSIWLIHAPPADLFLDVCASGEKVGSKAIYQFLNKFQPMLSIHGHIHESPEYNEHKWNHLLGDTLCIQGGQIGRDLHYSVVEIEDGEIKSKEHSIYGKYST